MMNASGRRPANASERMWSAADSRDESPNSSLFKKTFKYYKRRDVTPDFSNVANMRIASDERGITCTKFALHEPLSEDALRILGLRPCSHWTVSTMAHRPGMFMLNDIFEPSRYLEWISRSLYLYTEHPAFTNVGLHIADACNVSQFLRRYG